MIFVIIQLLSILYLVININQLSFYAYGLLLISGVVASFAIVNMGPSNINIMPSLKTNHQLTTCGIYRYVRHPMYSSILLAMFVFLLSNITVVGLTVYGTLVIDLWFKSALEEKYLLQKFNKYDCYMKKTGRFLPKIN